MWEAACFMGGMIAFMAIMALMPLVFELPEWVAKYVGKKVAQVGEQPVGDQDDLAARGLGDALRQTDMSSEVVAEVMAAFWAANPNDRRALAHLVSGLAADDAAVDEGIILAVVRSLPVSGRPPESGPERAAGSRTEHDHVSATRPQ